MMKEVYQHVGRALCRVICSYVNVSVAMAMVMLTSCSGFLDRETDSIFSDEEVFGDADMSLSVLAGLYNQVDHGPNFNNFSSFSTTTGTWGELDEASCFQPNNSTTFSTSLWRYYPYGYIRNLNMFLESVRKATALPATDRQTYEAETRFLRACAYFNMVRGLGGMPIVGDKVFSTSDDIATMQHARVTEAEAYDYIISECDYCASTLSTTGGVHQARASRWAALTLKARAAITAASLAKYNNAVTPDIVTAGQEVGIPPEKANEYYRIAAETAKEIIDSKQFALYDKYVDRAENFYRLFVDMTNNTEVIWARDYQYPDVVHSWSANSCAPSVTGNSASNEITPLLNLVESYEYIDNRDGHLKLTDEKGEYVFYASPADLFKNKDPRLKGTIICPGDEIDSKEVVYQAGQMRIQKKGSKQVWTTKTSAAGTTDDDGDIITAVNGPRASSVAWENTTGFNFRKYLDPTADGRKSSHGSEIWFIRMRYAEVLLIYAEAQLELGHNADGLEALNAVRKRAGLKPLSNYSLDDIEQERRVEFPLENQRYWDLKRWRRAHTEWDGTSENSRQWGLFPYKVKDLRSPQNGKWVFVKVQNSKMPNARRFEMYNYYNFLDNGWLSNNPLLVKNPYQ